MAESGRIFCNFGLLTISNVKRRSHEKAKHTMGKKTFLDANLNCNGIAIGLVKGNLLGNLAPKNGRSTFQLSVVYQFKFLRWNHHYTRWDKQARENRKCFGPNFRNKKTKWKRHNIHLKIQMKCVLQINRMR